MKQFDEAMLIIAVCLLTWIAYEVWKIQQVVAP